MQTPSLLLRSSGLGEARVRRKKKKEEGGGRGRREGAGACLTAPCCQVCLFVCPHTVEINLPSVELWTQRGEKVSKHNQDTCRQETAITPTADPSPPTTWCWRWGRGCAAGGANEGFGWVGGWVSKQVEALLQLGGDKLAGQSMSEQKAKNQLEGATL